MYELDFFQILFHQLHDAFILQTFMYYSSPFFQKLKWGLTTNFKMLNLWQNEQQQGFENLKAKLQLCGSHVKADI